MKSIVFIEANNYGSSVEGIKAAKKLGYYIHIITTRKKFLNQTLPEVDEILLMSVLDEVLLIAKLEEIREKHEVEIIISFLDPFVTLAAKLHNLFCNQNISHDIFRIMENKILTREFLQSKPYSPSYLIFKKNDALKNFLFQIKHKYPLILKSPTSTGSKDVYLINTENQMKHRINFLKKRNSNEDLLIEEYLTGPQFIVEAIVFEGIIQIAGVIEQEITKQNKFIVTGYSISSEMEDSIYSSIAEVTQLILTDLGIKNGNFHLEMRLVNNAWKIIEINPRISGGSMNKLLKEAYGFDYAEQILKVYRGEQPSIERKFEYCIYAHYITVNKVGKLISVSGIEQARKESGVIEVFIKSKEGQVLSPPLSMGHRYGYVIAKGQNMDNVKASALQAADYINFQLSPIL